MVIKEDHSISGYHSRMSIALLASKRILLYDALTKLGRVYEIGESPSFLSESNVGNP